MLLPAVALSQDDQALLPSTGAQTSLLFFRVGVLSLCWNHMAWHVEVARSEHKERAWCAPIKLHLQTVI